MPLTPFVSIIVPVFNGARFIRESLDSILDQTYRKFEVIVLDDASTDETPQIIRSYGDRVRCIRQTSNHGIYDNVNIGIREARGSLIAAYHADDIYHPEIIEREVEAFERFPSVGAVFCSDIFVDEAGREYGRLTLPTEVRGGQPLSFTTVFNALLAHKNSFLRCPGAMVRADVHARLGLYRQELFRNTSDLDMWIRIAQAYPIVILEDYLYRYRHFAGQSSKRYQHMRTQPENYFAIMDHHLAKGSSSVATRRALRDYEAHRSRDRLMAAVAFYVTDRQREARATLADVSLPTLASSERVQGWRMALLTVLLRILVRFPRVAPLATAFRRRWFAGSVAA